MVDTLTPKAQIEAVIFASPEPMKASEVAEILQNESLTVKDVEAMCDELVDEFSTRHGGFRLEYIKGMGYQFRTVQDAAPLMERQFAARPRPLSKASLETLSIIAYRQPVTRAEVEFIRGVDAGSIIKTLLDRSMIECVGRKEVPGRPMLFGTSTEFLKIFRLANIKDLPPLESFQPNLEVIQKALDKMEAGPEGEEGVDVEKFISDEEHGPQDDGAETLEAEAHPVTQVEGDDEVRELTGATAGGPEDADDEDFADEERDVQGATAAPLDDEDEAFAVTATDDASQDVGGEEPTQKAQTHDGDDETTEAGIPAGDRIEADSGELDR